MGTRINPYNIYAPCVGKGPPSAGYCLTQYLDLGSEHPPTSQTFVPCMNFTLEVVYMNLVSVQKALFIDLDKIPNQHWDICSQILDYSFYGVDMIPIYSMLVAHEVSVLLYSGDADSCVPYIGTQIDAEQIKANGTTRPWGQWLVDDQVAGYVFKGGDYLTYLTVKEAGHMVPTYKPKQALAFFTRFIQGKPI